MIPFNKPCVIGSEAKAIEKVIMEQNKHSGNGPFGKKCATWLEDKLDCKKVLLTPSCTAALEMTAVLINLEPGDEVILPSYTFVSTANAYALRGAALRFADVDPNTMNIDPVQIEAAVTKKTKAIVVVHYAGISCDMDEIMRIAAENNLWVIEDAAQGLMSTYKGRPLGTIGHFGTISFHDTKNYSCGEGGALLINDKDSIERAEILQEKGTNRSQFIRGRVDKYTWRDIGSSYLLSEFNAAYLHVQFEHADEINEDRLNTWKLYQEELKSLIDSGVISGPAVPDACTHNGHMFYIKSKDEKERSKLLDFLDDNGITAVSHYVPLHSAHAGRKFGKFVGNDRYTTAESERIIRLPIYYRIGEEAVHHVVKTIHKFYQA